VALSGGANARSRRPHPWPLVKSRLRTPAATPPRQLLPRARCQTAEQAIEQLARGCRCAKQPDKQRIRAWNRHRDKWERDQFRLDNPEQRQPVGHHGLDQLGEPFLRPAAASCSS
jgi:hypothetical protein